MKKLLFIALLILSLGYDAYSQKSYIVKGTLKGYEGPLSLVTDSFTYETNVKNGAFQFDISPSYPDRANFKLGVNSKAVTGDFILDMADFKVGLKLDGKDEDRSLDYEILEGGESMKLIHSFIKDRAFPVAEIKGSKERVAELVKRAIAFQEENPDQLAPLALIAEHSDFFTRSDLWIIYRKLSPQLRKTHYGKMLEKVKDRDATPAERLDHNVKHMNLIYEEPRDYVVENRADTLFYPNNQSKGFLGSFSYKIKPKQDDVLIAMGFYQLNSPGAVYSNGYSYDDSNQMSIIRTVVGLPMAAEERSTKKYNLELDTSKIKFFDKEQLVKYSATYGGWANVILDRPYWMHYKKLKVLFFFKKGEGEVYQYYFYNEGAPIDKVINETKYMLRFKQ